MPPARDDHGLVPLPAVAVRLLEGPHPWGELRMVSPGRGWVVLRLAVLPPGVTAIQRRALHFRAIWPVVGAVLGVLALVTAGAILSPETLTPLVVGGYLAGFAVGFVTTGDVARRVKRVNVTQFLEAGGLRSVGPLAELERVVSEFEQLDARHASGELDAVGYEHAWGRIYDAIESDEPPSIAHRHFWQLSGVRPFFRAGRRYATRVKRCATCGEVRAG